jgi:predicted regulator of Ras-like GTPase activity (Roadblock/LC7/MglB family)
MTASPFHALLAGLIRQRGVSGCMVVGLHDGLIVDSTLQIGLRGPVFAALVASLFRKAGKGARAAGFGETRFLQLDAELGRVCAVGRGELAIITVAEPRANLGLLRVELLKALEALP